MWLAACSPRVAAPEPSTTLPATTVTIVADGSTRVVTTAATTVGDALAEAGVTLGGADEVEPEPATPLPSAVVGPPLRITVVRVTETNEVIPEAIPFKRQIVRSAEMSPDDPPRLLQAGAAGLREVTVRIVFHDGLEVERWPTSTTIVEPAKDEIVMIGVAVLRDRLTFNGVLAYIDDGRALVLEGATDAVRQLAVDGQLDGRVFQLSPDGSRLLYTVTDAAAGATFRNSLWLIATAPEATPVPLAVENVLWAGWDPAAAVPRIAYTTARSITLPPGWEANNDLWLLDLPREGPQPAPVRLIESYPAAYSWWGGQFAWSPDGRLAYAFADEVGVLDVPAASDLANPAQAPVEPPRTILHDFTEYNTGADWAWLPALAWSADGRFLSYTDHAGDNPLASAQFDLRLADTQALNQLTLVEGVGIWSAVCWSPVASLPDRRVAYLAAAEPAASLDSGYVLWLADSDGSEARRLFPPEGESGLFARSQSLAWGPDADRLAFIFDNALHILDLPTGEYYRTGEDDSVSSHPTWAPYATVPLAQP